MSRKSITIEGVTFELAPTPLVQLSGLMEHIKAGTLASADGQRAQLEAIFWGARRAKAEITLPWLLENVDLFNASNLFRDFAEVNGLKITSAPKDGAPGEYQAPAAPSDSISDA